MVMRVRKAVLHLRPVLISEHLIIVDVVCERSLAPGQHCVAAVMSRAKMSRKCEVGPFDGPRMKNGHRL